jgi:hypothetical protein
VFKESATPDRIFPNSECGNEQIGLMTTQLELILRPKPLQVIEARKVASRLKLHCNDCIQIKPILTSY